MSYWHMLPTGWQAAFRHQLGVEEQEDAWGLVLHSASLCFGRAGFVCVELHPRLLPTCWPSQPATVLLSGIQIQGREKGTVPDLWNGVVEPAVSPDRGDIAQSLFW